MDTTETRRAARVAQLASVAPVFGIGYAVYVNGSLMDLFDTVEEAKRDRDSRNEFAANLNLLEEA